ncbi:HNH endonuclease [Streptomyces sp. NPDC048416]|uniref:HNH endonuclease n=1 Tax=Streptomyces sp. NPDC048416 TaxID=3365546 RepID=UPI00372410F5
MASRWRRASIRRTLQRTNSSGLTALPTKTQPQQSVKGVTPPLDEGHVDHVVRREDGGSGTPENGQLLCRECNVVHKHQ